MPTVVMLAKLPIIIAWIPTIILIIGITIELVFLTIEFIKDQSPSNTPIIANTIANILSSGTHEPAIATIQTISEEIPKMSLFAKGWGFD